MCAHHDKLAASLLAANYNIEARGQTPQKDYAVVATGKNNDAYIVVCLVSTDEIRRVQHVYVTQDGVQTAELTALPQDVHVMFRAYRSLYTDSLRLVASQLSRDESWVVRNRERLFVQHLAAMPEDYTISRALMTMEDVKLMRKLPDWEAQLSELYNTVFREVQVEVTLPFLTTENLVQPKVFA